MTGAVDTVGPIAGLIIGVALVALAPVVYRFAPRLNAAVRGLLNRGAFGGMDRGDDYWERFNSFERVAAALMVGGIGIAAIVVSILTLAGH